MMGKEDIHLGPVGCQAPGNAPDKRCRGVMGVFGIGRGESQNPHLIGSDPSREMPPPSQEEPLRPFQRRRA